MKVPVLSCCFYQIFQVGKKEARDIASKILSSNILCPEESITFTSDIEPSF